MLEHSLDDNPSDVYRGNDSRIAGLINQDKAYLNALDKKISESTDGTVSGYLEDFAFDEGDLYYSIHNASIYVEGYQLPNGNWVIKGTLKDVYDFTKLQSIFIDDGKIKTDIRLGTVANDAAVFSQATGAINPYNVVVEFYTVR